MPTITFDMDGTIADLYGVEDWEARLNAHDATPYTEAQPLVNMERLTELCGRLYHILCCCAWQARKQQRL